MKKLLILILVLAAIGGLVLLIHQLNVTGSFGAVYRLPFGL